MNLCRLMYDMQLSLCLFCVFVSLAGLEKCLGRTHSPQMLSFGRCGRLCATTTGTLSLTGACVCLHLDLCGLCRMFLSECLLFAFPVFCNISTRGWNTESAGWGHSPPPQSHVSLHASLYRDDHMLFFFFKLNYATCAFQCTWSTAPWIQSILIPSSSAYTSKFQPLENILGDF